MSKFKSWLRKKQLQFSDDVQIGRFITYVDLYCKTHNVDVVFHPDKLVDIGNGQMCNGYFYGNENTRDEGELVVATGKEQDHWLQILIHEFAHCTQWVENGLAWNITYTDEGQDAYTMLQDWMTGDIKLDPEVAECYAALSRMHEHDCDRRALKMIEEWKLPIDTEKYIQKSNAYHLFYNYIGKTGKWYPEEEEPYTEDKIWKSMPTTWLDDYDNPPAGIMDLYFEVYGTA